MAKAPQPSTKFAIGDRVVDLGGYRGTIEAVTKYEGSAWYDVRFGRSGSSVRYDSDLRLDA